MQTSLLKSLLAADFFETNKGRVKPAMFDDGYAKIYEMIATAHSKYSHDLSPTDILAIWKATHPAATRTEAELAHDAVLSIVEADSLTPIVASDVIENLWKQETGREIANLGIALSEGHYEAMARLKSLLERVEKGYTSDEFGDPVTDDLYELLASASDEARFSFNIESLKRQVYGIGPSEFMVAFARPECGKSTFVVSLCAGPNGFCQQGAKVLYLGNEEAVRRTKLRAIQAWTGMTKEEVRDSPDLAKTRYLAIKDRLIMKDTQEWDLDKVDRYVGLVKPDILVIDQLDKVNLSQSFASGHEKLRELYRQSRELAKRHEVALIGVCQASADAEGRTRLDFSMMEGSKTGKAAEADLIIGIGKHAASEDDAPDTMRFLNITKNKLSGYHGVIPCNIQAEIGRYAV